MKHSKRGKPFQQSYSFEFYLTSDYYCNKKTIMKSTEIRLILCLFLTHLFIPYTVWSQNPELRVLQFQQKHLKTLLFLYLTVFLCLFLLSKDFGISSYSYHCIITNKV